MSGKVARALAGEPMEQPPVWLMRQAGRYLPEYRALRAKAGSFLDLCLNPEWASTVTLQPVQRFDLDAAILFSDILIVPWALGQELRFVEGEGPRLPPLRDREALSALRLERAADRFAPVIETVRRTHAGLAADKSLIGFAGSPWTVCCYMLEGGGSRDYAEAREAVYRDPDFAADLLALVEETTVAYLRAQLDAGADLVMLFDSWAGLLPPLLFERCVIEPTARIVAALRQSHPGKKIIGFPRLAGLSLGRYAERTGVDAVGVDTATDPAAAARLVPERFVLQGNLDPIALLAGGAALREAADRIRDAWRGRPYIFNLGHGIVPQTPPEHVADLVRMLRA